MKVPFGSGSAIGPNDMAFLQPSMSTKKLQRLFMSGTVMPVWSCPRIPGNPSACAALSPSVMANVAAALQRTALSHCILSLLPARCSRRFRHNSVMKPRIMRTGQHELRDLAVLAVACGSMLRRVAPEARSLGAPALTLLLKL